MIKKNTLRKLITTIVGASLITVSNAQIIVTNTQSPANYVQNVLMGNGVVASNITYNTSAVNAQSIQGNVTYFDASATSFPLARGVLLTTGNGVAAIGPNSSGSFTNNTPATPSVALDPDLNAIANGSVTNGAILEFDFIPSGDTVSFRYVFGSDEYPEFSPSTFNDAFGFFLSGPGISGPYSNGSVNIALIPGTSTPVTINNVGDASNTQYYVDNLGGAGYGTAIQYDGTTVIFTAVSQVICGQTYHIKLAISNVGDQSYDSGVFLEADSFSSEAVDISVATVGGDTTVIEGCTDATFYFTRPLTQIDDSLEVFYGISGDATMGVDYNNLPNPVIFVPGEDSIVLTLTPVLDGIDETPEYVTLIAMTVTECGDTIISTGTLWIIDGPDLPINESDPTIFCPNDSVPVTATASGGFAPYTITWSYAGQTGTSAFVPGNANGTYDYYVFAVDACGNTGTDTVTVTVNQTLAIDEMNATPTASCQNTGIVWGLGEGVTGQPMYHWEGPGEGGPFQIDASVLQNLPSGWYIFTIEDDVCSVTDSIFVDIELPPVANFSTTPTSGCSPLSVEITNTSQNAVNYAWDFGNGNTLNTTNLDNPINQTYPDNGVIRLIASKGPCADTAYQAITIAICGCTSPEALNYNPLATIDDGSCVFPDPTVETPNVFTPNGDGVNDVFELKTTYAVRVEIKIMDRWGITMYEGTDAKAVWDGQGANEGVYFFTYTVTGMLGDELTGHGFVQLFR